MTFVSLVSRITYQYHEPQLSTKHIKRKPAKMLDETKRLRIQDTGRQWTYGGTWCCKEPIINNTEPRETFFNSTEFSVWRNKCKRTICQDTWHMQKNSKYLDQSTLVMISTTWLETWNKVTGPQTLCIPVAGGDRRFTYLLTFTLSLCSNAN